MRQFVCLTLLLGLSGAPWAWGDAPAKPAGPSADQLLQQLGSRDPKAREAASKALAELGPEALPALQKAKLRADPELRRRLEELIPVLERAGILTPKRVTLHMTNKPMSAVCAELAKQTGYKIEFMNWGWMWGMWGNVPDKALYTFHLEKLPFWEALDKICDSTGMILQQNWWGDDTMRLYSADSYVPFNYRKGPFKVIANTFNYQRNNNFGQLPKNGNPQAQHGWENLNVGLMLCVEPKLPIIRLGTVRWLTVEDDEGHSMIPPPVTVNQGNMYYGGRMFWGWGGGNYRCYSQQTQASLLWPSKTAKTVKVMRGIMPVTLLSEQKPTIITERLLSSKGKTFKVGQTTFKVEDVTELAGKQHQIKIHVTEESKDNPNDWTRIQSLQQRLEVHDDRGNKLPWAFQPIQWQNNNSVQLQLTTGQQNQPGMPVNAANGNGHAKFGPPNHLVYYAWTLMEHEVEFEFHDVPLP
jgi:hypothetical protein